MKYTKKEFEKEIYDFWTDKFNVPREAAHKKCSYVIYEDSFEQSNKTVVYDMKDMTVVRIGTALAKDLDMPAGLIDGDVIDTEQIKKRIVGIGLSIEEEYAFYDFFLDPADFINANEDNRFQVRALDIEHDKDSMLELFAVCTEEEMDDADIYIDKLDPVNYGVLDGDKLIAYCSYRMFGDHICDAGVIIHPEHRNKGLGKAVISSLVQHCFENDVIPMYRVFGDNGYSLRIPQALGFRLMVLVHLVEAKR